MTTDWPFADPPNFAALTQRSIMERGRPILLVFHEAEDGTWQFLDGGEVSMKEAVFVCLSHVLGVDPTIAELADLPLGWEAERSTLGKPWTRRKATETD